ncbi:TlpA family protein disulfide reductase [Gluconobacter sp. LMG 31484]|uniref:TlpA family protein disulfide reductase n=1 Tax=Gluconobacter vitians TaxID=2728102 RepID=A0ABR9Y1N7_9PROT|nr:TlpA disulfide reductase family protein [Gluconobacter vitians]MBF0857868.1 TlpA family protein disulfide reductase [Gluconobacter vitians]
MGFPLTRRHLLGGAGAFLVSGRALAAAEKEEAGKGLAFEPNSFGKLATPKVLPSLSVQNEQGQDVPLSHWYGKPFILHFWATWCPPCIRELPSVNATAKALGADGPQIVAVAVRGSTVPKVRAFYDAHGIDALPLLVDPVSGVMMEMADQAALVQSVRQVRPDDLKELTPDIMSLHGVPRSLILNGKGEVVAESIGNMDWSADAVRHTVQALAG